jgi:hypothetical protein
MADSNNADSNNGFDKVYLAPRQTAQVQGLDLTDCDDFNYFFVQQNKQGDVWVLPISKTLFLEMEKAGFTVLLINSMGRPAIEGEDVVYTLH